VTFRGYIRFINYETKRERKIDRGKTAADVILKAVRAVKLHNLSI